MTAKHIRKSQPTADEIERRSIPEPNTGCWLWTGTLLRRGYGAILTPDGMRPAHRVMYALVRGSIPDGHLIMHRCDNPPCVNPAHLTAGTHTDNMRDMRAKGRGVYRHGVHHGNSVLSDAAVLEIRRRAASGESGASLAGAFGVSASLIHSVVRRKAWAHVRENVAAGAVRDVILKRVVAARRVHGPGAVFEAVSATLVGLAADLGVDLETTDGEVGCDHHNNPDCRHTADEIFAERRPREMATVDNDGLPAPMCQGCRQRHPTRVKCPTQSRVHDEPAHEVSPGTCKGCDAPEDAPPERHRFSCTVRGKRQAKAGAYKGTSGKVKR